MFWITQLLCLYHQNSCTKMNTFPPHIISLSSNSYVDKCLQFCSAGPWIQYWRYMHWTFLNTGDDRTPVSLFCFLLNPKDNLIKKNKKNLIISFSCFKRYDSQAKWCDSDSWCNMEALCRLPIVDSTTVETWLWDKVCGIGETFQDITWINMGKMSTV